MSALTDWLKLSAKGSFHIPTAAQSMQELLSMGAGGQVGHVFARGLAGGLVGANYGMAGQFAYNRATGHRGGYLRSGLMGAAGGFAFASRGAGVGGGAMKFGDYWKAFSDERKSFSKMNWNWSNFK